MCTMIVERVKIEGSGKGKEGWFQLDGANVSYDHPFNAPIEHALNIDFVNEAQGASALDQAKAGGHLESQRLKN